MESFSGALKSHKNVSVFRNSNKVMTHLEIKTVFKIDSDEAGGIKSAVA